MSDEKIKSFTPVSPKVDFAQLEREILLKWEKGKILEKYLHKNNSSNKKFSFLDGPITANNPMGVHHAWGRTYKDFWQRFFNLQGYKQRFQNGFDEQGLWVEVEVEKELGIRNKKDIENLVAGDKFKSLEKFINLCKERVKKYSAVQTEQSKRLGYFMDWDNSYHTSSDENNYAIWNFLKIMDEKGWLYKGRDSVPWCPRCGTAISQHEILTEEYKELTHDSVYFKLPIIGKINEFLLVWTTTPWTIPANVAAAVNLEENYCAYKSKGETLWLMEKRYQDLKKGILQGFEKVSCLKGSQLLGWEYEGLFDEFERVKKLSKDYVHRVVGGDDRILPVGSQEGTGIVHVSPGAGAEDFALGKKENIPLIDVIDEEANYLEEMGDFSAKNAKKHPEIIIDYLKEKETGKFFFKTEKYTHRYPTCWRCKTELVWRVVDEWYIAMDRKDESGKTFKEQMVEVAKKINWLPKWGLDRELDWLKNMHDWLISKKRYWGLALPIWECGKCHDFVVIGSFEELKEKQVEGFEKFQGHSPHRPWVDEVLIKCPKCQGLSKRVQDVGSPWLDAGIVSVSTMPSDWFPADFIVESFPGQFKNWFYALIAMSTGIKGTNPAKTILGHGLVKDEKGEEMHKSKGNAIEFNEAADKIGVDVMRWLYLRTNPEQNVNFGYHAADEIRRFFHLRLWNVYSFFVMYANVDQWNRSDKKQETSDKKNVLDRWILSKLNKSIISITKYIQDYDAQNAAKDAENFVINDLSNWYVRRIRLRVSPSLVSEDKNDAYQTLWTILTTYSKVLSPFIPFITDEIYSNLTGQESVNLTQFPESDTSFIDQQLENEMDVARQIVELAHAKRKEEEIKVRQPLASLVATTPTPMQEAIKTIIADEVNVKKVINIIDETISIELDTVISKDLKDEGWARDIVRKIQEERKILATRPDEKVDVVLEDFPKKFEDYIKKKALVNSLSKGDSFEVNKIT